MGCFPPSPRPARLTLLLVPPSTSHTHDPEYAQRYTVPVLFDKVGGRGMSVAGSH